MVVSRHRQRLKLIGCLVVVNIVSLALSLFVVHLTAGHLSDDSTTAVSITSLLSPTALAVMIAVAMIVNGSFVGLVMTRLMKPSLRPDDPDDNMEAMMITAGAYSNAHSTGARRLLTLTRHAERLDKAEQDLVRKIAENYPTDRGTDKLLCEMRICTNRLLAQLSDIERSEKVGR